MVFVIAIQLQRIDQSLRDLPFLFLVFRLFIVEKNCDFLAEEFFTQQKKKYNKFLGLIRKYLKYKIFFQD